MKLCQSPVASPPKEEEKSKAAGKQPAKGKAACGAARQPDYTYDNYIWVKQLHGINGFHGNSPDIRFREALVCSL